MVLADYAFYVPKMMLCCIVKWMHWMTI